MEILLKPNKILAKPTPEVEKIDKNILSAISKMWEIHKAKAALGLAANQVGLPYKIAVIGFEPTAKQLKEDRNLKPIAKRALINPKITSKSKKEFIDKEACLSVPNAHYDIPRSDKIQVEYLDEKGQKQKLRARGMLARIIQHEIDHLNGRTIADYK